MNIVFPTLLLLLLVSVTHVVDGFSIVAPQMASNPPHSSEVHTTLVDHAVAWATANGMGMMVNDEGGLVTCTHVPFSLLPYALPPDSYKQATQLAPLLNKLVDRVSRHGAWLKATLADVLAGDPFTADLMRIFETIEAEGGPRQPVCMAINRSDYMLHAPDDGTSPYLLQVELNTIASSFGCLSALTANMHRHLLGRFATEISNVGETVRDHAKSVGIDPVHQSGGLESLIPENPTLEALPKALAAAHEHYGVRDAVVLFVVQPGETNAVDQRLLEIKLWDNHSVRAVRMSLAEIEADGILGEDGTLKLGEGKVEVAVVYFRAGYDPRDYFGQAEWDARLKVERSKAIKSPSIAYQLAGTKKVQQALAQEGQVELFLGPEDGALVRRCYAGLYPVGPEGCARATADAIIHPENYVLKPQREGGGHNLYDVELKKKLDVGGAAAEELRSFILMQRIFPRSQPAIMVNRGRCVAGPSISELGVYGIYLGGDDGELLNEFAGYLVRTKLEGVDEGGVAAGYAVLSSAIVGEPAKS